MPRRKLFTKYLQFPAFAGFLHLLPRRSTLRTVLQKVLLLVSSLKSIFAGFATKRSQNIYIFNLPQQRNVALLLFVKGKKTRNWIGAFWDYFPESAYLRIRGRPYEISRKKVFTNWSLKAVNDEYFRKEFIKISPQKFFVCLNFHRKGHFRQH